MVNSVTAVTSVQWAAVYLRVRSEFMTQKRSPPHADAGAAEVPALGANKSKSTKSPNPLWHRETEKIRDDENKKKMWNKRERKNRNNQLRSAGEKRFSWCFSTAGLITASRSSCTSLTHTEHRSKQQTAFCTPRSLSCPTDFTLILVSRCNFHESFP